MKNRRHWGVMKNKPEDALIASAPEMLRALSIIEDALAGLMVTEAVSDEGFKTLYQIVEHIALVKYKAIGLRPPMGKA